QYLISALLVRDVGESDTMEVDSGCDDVETAGERARARRRPAPETAAHVWRHRAGNCGGRLQAAHQRKSRSDTGGSLHPDEARLGRPHMKARAWHRAWLHPPFDTSGHTIERFAHGRLQSRIID